MAKQFIDFKLFSSVSLKQNPFEDDSPIYQALSSLVLKYKKDVTLYNMHYEFKNININVYDNFIFFSYNLFAIFDHIWTNLEIICRPIVFDVTTGEIVARGMNKFFNYNEVEATKIENLERFLTDDSVKCEVGEKIDGTLILVWKYKNKIYASSKGAMNTVQGVWAYEHFIRNYTSDLVPEGVTLFFEAVYPDNRLDSQLVIDYKNMQGLFFIGGRNNYGNEYSYATNKHLADVAAYQIVQYQKVENLAEFMEDAVTETDTEGYVMSFYNLQGKVFRVKVKTDWYKEMKKIYNNLSFDVIKQKIQSGEDKVFLESTSDERTKARVQSVIDRINAFVENKLETAQKYFEEIIWELEHTDYYNINNEDKFVTFKGIDIKAIDFKVKSELNKKIKRFFAKIVNDSSVYSDKNYTALIFMLLAKQDVKSYILDKITKKDIGDYEDNEKGNNEIEDQQIICTPNSYN